MVLTGAVNAGTIAAHLRLDSTLEQDGAKARKSIGLVTGALVGATVAAGALALAFSAKVGKGVIEAGSDVEEMTGKFNAVFRENAGAVSEWADSFGDDVGRSKFELMGFASTLQDTFVPMGFARDEGAELSKQLTELAIDLASFNDEAEPETIAALQSALVGNHETMRKYGVIITQTTLDQKLLTMGVQGGIKAATEQEKVQARMNIIMEGTTDAQGDAARTSSSLANMQRKLKSTMSEMMGEAGRDELPEMTKVLEDFDTWGEAGGYENIQGFFGDVATGSTAAAKGISEFTKGITTVYTELSASISNTKDNLDALDKQYAESNVASTKWLLNISKKFKLPTAFEDFVMGGLSEDELKLMEGLSWEVIKAVDAVDELADSEDEFAASSKSAADSVIEDAKAVQEAFSNTEIPDWAGHSDYIRSIGGIPDQFNVPSISPTVTAGTPQATATGGSVSMLSTINTSIKDGNTAIITAINGISLGAGRTTGGIGAGDTSQASPETIYARMKQNFERASTSSLRL